mmetsp:Transcript_35495/g.82222  ORF Transcript_35495/g.82222 Transcript_35495/m.82222 type:complete len:221 (+) Transcript_35495:464-1126(+)
MGHLGRLRVPLVRAEAALDRGRKGCSWAKQGSGEWRRGCRLEGGGRFSSPERACDGLRTRAQRSKPFGGAEHAPLLRRQPCTRLVEAGRRQRKCLPRTPARGHGLGPALGVGWRAGGGEGRVHEVCAELLGSVEGQAERLPRRALRRACPPRSCPIKPARPKKRARPTGVPTRAQLERERRRLGAQRGSLCVGARGCLVCLAAGTRDQHPPPAQQLHLAA